MHCPKVKVDKLVSNLLLANLISQFKLVVVQSGRVLNSIDRLLYVEPTDYYKSPIILRNTLSFLDFASRCKDSAIPSNERVYRGFTNVVREVFYFERLQLPIKSTKTGPVDFGLLW